MSERVEQMYWLENRGIVVALPPVSTGSGEPEFMRQTRLRVLSGDSIMRKRYPFPEDGQSYMPSVDLGWREKLYSKAETLAAEIIEHTRKMGKVTPKGEFPDPQKDIAIILFGSIAKNLTRSRNNLDPSNIDIAVIGNFSEEERKELFERMKPTRDEIELFIGNNVGVHIQSPEKVTNGDYCQAIMYIGSSARVLHDPAKIWTDIEAETLTYLFIKNSENTDNQKLRAYKKLYGKKGFGNGLVSTEVYGLYDEDFDQIDLSKHEEIGILLMTTAQENPAIKKALEKCAAKAGLNSSDLMKICKTPALLLRNGKKQNQSYTRKRPLYNSCFEPTLATR